LAQTESPHLVRGIGLLGAVSANMPEMIGAGPFITLPILLAKMNGPQAILGWVLGALCALIALAMVSVLIWLLVGERIGQRQIEMLEPESPPTDEETERTVRAAVDAGLAELDDADADPRRAVIACWVRLEAAAAAAGTERSPGDTSTELVSRLLARHRVSEPVLSALAEVCDRTQDPATVRGALNELSWSMLDCTLRAAPPKALMRSADMAKRHSASLGADHRRILEAIEDHAAG